MKIERFEEIESWKGARELTAVIYKMTGMDGFVKDFGLKDQIQRACVSIMANIAEGFIRRSDREFVQFLFIAMSSAAEVQSHLYIALDQAYINQDQFNSIYEQANKRTGSLSLVPNAS